MSTLNILPDPKMLTVRTFILAILLSISFVLLAGLVKGFYYYAQLNKTESALETNYKNSHEMNQSETIQFNSVGGHVTVLK